MTSPDLEIRALPGSPCVQNAKIVRAKRTYGEQKQILEEATAAPLKSNPQGWVPVDDGDRIDRPDRSDEVSKSDRDRIAAQRVGLAGDDGIVMESYRRVSVADALPRLHSRTR